MRLFGPLYDRVLRWSTHRHAERYLAALSFAESSFFPIPPDVLLAPMTLARPDRGWWLATLTTIASVAGGLAGFAIGWFALDMIEPLLIELGYWESYERATDWFDRWGFWAVLVAGFSPVPYKIFTIAAGALQMFLPGFLLASLLGRGGRFFLVAGILVFGGARMEQTLRRNIDALGWISVGVILLAIVWWLLE
ncbi:MAG TPA: YqaA family protein [Gammaproteobacteria bacterium]|nr:YqaA family protein [Gammaproteobacteria bacterium]